PREPGPARRVLVQQRPVPAVGIAEVHDLGRAEDRGARLQLRQPSALVGAIPYVTVASHGDDHPVTVGRQPGDRPAGQQHLIVWVRVKRHDCFYGGTATTETLSCVWSDVLRPMTS